jgi:hypothetical protein
MTTPTVIVRGNAVVPGEPDEVEIGTLPSRARKERARSR